MWTAKPSVSQSEVPEEYQYPTILERVDRFLCDRPPLDVSPCAIASMYEPKPLTNAEMLGRDGCRVFGLNPDDPFVSASMMPEVK